MKLRQWQVFSSVMLRTSEYKGNPAHVTREKSVILVEDQVMIFLLKIKKNFFLFHTHFCD